MPDPLKIARPIPSGRLADITNRHHGRSDPLIRELLAEIAGLRATVYRQAEYTGRLQRGIANLRNEIAKATQVIATEIKNEQEKENATEEQKRMTASAAEKTA